LSLGDELLQHALVALGQTQTPDAFQQSVPSGVDLVLSGVGVVQNGLGVVHSGLKGGLGGVGDTLGGQGQSVLIGLLQQVLVAGLGLASGHQSVHGGLIGSLGLQELHGVHTLVVAGSGQILSNQLVNGLLGSGDSGVALSGVVLSHDVLVASHSQLSQLTVPGGVHQTGLSLFHSGLQLVGLLLRQVAGVGQSSLQVLHGGGVGHEAKGGVDVVVVGDLVVHQTLQLVHVAGLEHSIVHGAVQGAQSGVHHGLGDVVVFIHGLSHSLGSLVGSHAVIGPGVGGLSGIQSGLQLVLIHLAHSLGGGDDLGDLGDGVGPRHGDALQRLAGVQLELVDGLVQSAQLHSSVLAHILSG